MSENEKKKPNEDWESFSDRRIREAEAEGAFQNLPGFGKPIPGIDQPLDENWWIREKMKREQLSLVPPVLEARLEIEKTMAEIEKLSNEWDVRRRLRKLNEKIRKAHYSPTPGPSDGVREVDVEAVVRRWKQKREGASSEGVGWG